ncbi:MAG TPA: phage tail sheath C-terminal domain-containing protein [bacterium]|nr:phage tail sheath C-terminal domain-containing protein [bacterium]
MPEYLSPGVYVEEVSSGIKPIEGVGTSTGAFIGIAEKGPIGGAEYDDGPGRPVLITNFGDFTRTFGSFVNGEYLAYAVQQFFTEGGTRCYVTRTAHFTDITDPDTLTATPATVTLQDAGATDVLEITAINEGLWGNNLSVSVEASSKFSTILNGALSSGDTSAVLQSAAGVEIGTILGFADPGSPGTLITTAVVNRVAGKQVFFVSGVGSAVSDGAIVSAQDFTMLVRDGDDVVETFANLTMENTHATDFVENRINEGGSRSRYIRVEDVGGVGSNEPPDATTGYVFLSGGANGDPEDANDYIGNSASQTGFYAFDTVDDINILSAPGITLRSVILAGMTYCENRKDVFYVGEIVSSARTVTEVLNFKNATGSYAGQQAFNSSYGALYWPWVRVLDPLTGRPISMPPSGAVVGSYSATDVRRGVHKAPAGIEDGFLNSVVGIEKIVTKGEHDLLNPAGVNVIRSFPGLGIVLWGARTVSQDAEWKYINVRRLFLFLEESIDEGTQWVVFEPNDPVLWARIVRNVSAFLRIQWLEGKLVGSKPEEAFFVKCDAETNPPESVDLGRVITVIGVAPSKPAEFVIFRIMQQRPGEGA